MQLITVTCTFKIVQVLFCGTKTHVEFQLWFISVVVLKTSTKESKSQNGLVMIETAQTLNLNELYKANQLYDRLICLRDSFKVVATTKCAYNFSHDICFFPACRKPGRQNDLGFSYSHYFINNIYVRVIANVVVVII